MPRVSQESINRLNAFIDSLPPEARNKCALCNETLVHLVKTAEVESGAGTATVTRALADRINEDVKNGLYKIPSPPSGGEQHIYVAKTKIYPGLVKIGKTTSNPKQRVASLGSCLLDDFELVYSVSFDMRQSIHLIEKGIHASLSKYRVQPDREWFYENCIDVFYGIVVSLKLQELFK